jgi:SAM-dependent methyltransferase
MNLEKLKVLDIGHGVAGFSLALAQNANKVINFDLRYNSTRNLRNTINEKHIENILSSRSDANNMPYKENSFDLVILNGVLEYTANGQEGDPRNVQKKILKDVKKLLRPGGWLYLGIENRYYLKFLLGYRVHEDMPFATVLPRELANQLSKTLYKKEFRNYIYSYNGYKKLLDESGLEDIEFYTALPSYKYPEHIISIDDKKAVIQTIKHLDTNIGYKLLSYLLAQSTDLYKKLGPDFVILCKA